MLLFFFSPLSLFFFRFRTSIVPSDVDLKCRTEQQQPFHNMKYHLISCWFRISAQNACELHHLQYDINRSVVCVPRIIIFHFAIIILYFHLFVFILNFCYCNFFPYPVIFLFFPFIPQHKQRLSFFPRPLPASSPSSPSLIINSMCLFLFLIWNMNNFVHFIMYKLCVPWFIIFWDGVDCRVESTHHILSSFHGDLKQEI